MENFLSILIAVTMGCFSGSVATGDIQTPEKTVYINETAATDDSIVVFEDDALFSLRGIFNALGATVTQEEGNISILYDGKEYLCEMMAPNPMFEETEYIYIKDVEKNEYVFLNDMATCGLFKEIDGEIYLYSITAENLLEYLGCAVEINNNTCEVKIKTV